MRWYTDSLRQKATYWEKQADDGAGGATFAVPIVIDCRWEDIQLDQVGVGTRDLVLRSRVHVNQDLVEGSFLKLGEIDSSTASPLDVEGAYPIVRFEKFPNIRGDFVLRRALL